MWENIQGFWSNWDQFSTLVGLLFQDLFCWLLKKRKRKNRKSKEDLIFVITQFRWKENNISSLLSLFHVKFDKLCHFLFGSRLQILIDNREGTERSLAKHWNYSNFGKLGGYWSWHQQFSALMHCIANNFRPNLETIW